MKDNTTLILSGSGYELLVSPDAEARKTELITAAQAIVTVTSNTEASTAQEQVKALAAMRNLTEKSRTTVKEPVLEVGRVIDATAKNFVAGLKTEEDRLKKLIENHAVKVEQERRAAEAERQRIERERLAEVARAERAAQAAREAQERAEREAREAAARAEIAAATGTAQAGDDGPSEEDLAAAAAIDAAAEAARIEADNKERAAALTQQVSEQVRVIETAPVPKVRFTPDFEVVDVDKLYFEQPGLVELTVRRRETLEYLKGKEAEGIDIVSLGEAIGLKVTMKPVVGTR